MEIIDSHLHIFERVKGFGFKGEYRPLGGGFIGTDTGERFQLFPAELGDTGVSPEAILGLMDRHGVSRAVVLQGAGYGYQNQYYAELMQTLCAQRLLFAGYVDPEAFMFSQILSHLVDELGFRVLKLELSTLGGLYGVHADNVLAHPNMQQLFAAMQRVGGTIALDIGDPSESSYQPGLVRALALQYPGARVVMCHLMEPKPGIEAVTLEAIESMLLPNVWFDMSSVQAFYGESGPYTRSLAYLAQVKQITGAQRLLWGSDAPGALVANNYGGLLSSFATETPLFSDAEKRLVLCENALQAYPFEQTKAAGGG